MKEQCDGYLDDKATTTSNNNNNDATTNTMKERNRQHRDIFFVNNGDFVDGTGLSQTEDPGYLIPLLEKMPYDAVNCGNHELYSNRNIEYMKRPGTYCSKNGQYIFKILMLYVCNHFLICFLFSGKLFC